MLVYSSVILLLIGVPVANVTPLPPVSSSRYWHLLNISCDFCASVWAIPATFRILVYRNKFLYECDSSTKSLSTPNCSKVTTLSLRDWSLSLSSLVISCFLDFSICLMVYRSPLSAFACAMASVISSICLSSIATCLSCDRGIFSNCV